MEDEEIVEMYFARNEAAVSFTEKKYGGYLRSIAYNILNSMDDARECENDTYFSAWREIPPMRPASLKGFLAKIVRSIALDRLDYNRAAKRNSELTAVFSELENVASMLPDPHEELESKILAAQISTFLRGIKPTSRGIFVRRYWYGDSLAEIARRFGISEGKAASSLFRTRSRLKKYLCKEGAVL